MRVPPAVCVLAASLAACSTHGAQTVTTSAPTSPPASSAKAIIATPPVPRTEKWVELQVGQCVADLPPADLSRIAVTVVDCGTAHLAEVYLRAPMAVDSALVTVATKECNAAFSPYTGQPVGSGPLSVGWLIDSNMDRTGATPMPSTVICLVQAANGQQLTGSARH